jgi:hypothetical protein
VDVIAEADKVVARFKCSGRTRVSGAAWPSAAGDSTSVDEIYIFRLKGGKLDSALAVVEGNLTRVQHLGLKSSAPARLDLDPVRRRPSRRATQPKRSMTRFA